MNLSRYVLAVTVDDPASITPPPAEVETPDAAVPGAGESGKKSDDGTTSAAPEAAAAAPEKKAAPEENSDKTAENSEKTEENGKTGTAAADAGKPGAVVVAAVKKKPDPAGPKCVQLKIKPDWRMKGGGHKRRRGDLDKGTGRDGGRYSWPEGRPEYCRFVLYKENSDTVSGGCRQGFWRLVF